MWIVLNERKMLYQKLTNQLNVLLTVHHSISVQLNQRDTLFIQFIEKLQPCHSQMTYACIIPNTVCAAHPEDEQLMLETCRGP
jgi:hypothetical protein